MQIVSFALVESGRCNLHVCSRLLCETLFIEMPSLNRNEKVTCDNCATQNTKFFLARQKESFSAGTLHCTQSPSFPQNPKLILIIILLRSTVPQNLMLPSSVNFVIKSFKNSTLYNNMKTPKMVFLSGQQMLMRTIPWTKLMMWISKRSCVLVSMSW